MTLTDTQQALYAALHAALLADDQQAVNRKVCEAYKWDKVMVIMEGKHRGTFEVDVETGFELRLTKGEK